LSEEFNEPPNVRIKKREFARLNLPDGHPQNQNRSPAIRSGVSAERRHLKKNGTVCGGLPTRRYGEGESFAVSLKIRATGFAGHLQRFPAAGPSVIPANHMISGKLVDCVVGCGAWVGCMAAGALVETVEPRTVN
jgi:hypothetical protein